MSLFDTQPPAPPASATSRAAARAVALSAADLDLVLTAQLAVAWAGERGDEDDPRLGWWRTSFASEFGGQAVFAELLPATWRWASLEAAREAARRVDAAARARDHAPDAVISLFHFGAVADELLADRLRTHKTRGGSPLDSLRGLRPVIGDTFDGALFDRARFAAWVDSHPRPATTPSAIGRRLGAPPATLAERVAALVGALAPLESTYPLPHLRLAP